MDNSSYLSQFEITRAAEKTLMTKVYGWMFLALMVTAATSYMLMGAPNLMATIFSSSITYWGIIIAELALVFILVGRINKMSFNSAFLMFIVYALLNGITMSILLVMAGSGAVAAAFFTTAGTFGITSLWGFVTKKDLSGWGNILFMALIGLIIASVVNIFLANSALDWIITYGGVLIFVGLTAYDTQKIKQILHDQPDSEATRKVALMGALTLYLDFINLFLYILRIFSSRD